MSLIVGAFRIHDRLRKDLLQIALTIKMARQVELKGNLLHATCCMFYALCTCAANIVLFNYYVCYLFYAIHKYSILLIVVKPFLLKEFS